MLTPSKAQGIAWNRGGKTARGQEDQGKHCLLHSTGLLHSRAQCGCLHKTRLVTVPAWIPFYQPAGYKEILWLQDINIYQPKAILYIVYKHETYAYLLEIRSQMPWYGQGWPWVSDLSASTSQDAGVIGVCHQVCGLKPSRPHAY